MIKDNDKNLSSDDEAYEESDDQEQSKLERSFMDNCETENKEKNKPSFCLEIPKSIEMMFILFSYYKEDLASIGLDCNCRVKISLNKIKIESENSQEDVDKCYAKTSAYLQKISYTDFGHENKFKILNSPYFNKKAEQRGFSLCKFNQTIYCHSNKMSEKILLSTMKDLFLGQYLFTVTIKSVKAKQRQIYNHYRSFIKKMMQYHSEEFKSREVVVELDYSENKIDCIGNSQRNLVAVKNMLKNLLQSTVILIIKFESQQQIDEKSKKLKQYVKKGSTFPIFAGRIQKKSITIISKQNVVRKLLQKQKVRDIIKFDNKTQIGMFIPRRYNYLQKKLMIEQICTKKGYDFTNMGDIYHYFKKMFIHEDQQVSSQQVLSLVHEILQAVKQNKQKFDVPQQFKNMKLEKKDIEVTQGQYYSTGEISRQQAFSKILKRDVLKQKLKMSKPAFVKYKILQAEQINNIYWYVKDGNKIRCQVEEMKPGTQYFMGKVKQNENQELYFIESKLKII